MYSTRPQLCDIPRTHHHSSSQIASPLGVKTVKPLRSLIDARFFNEGVPHFLGRNPSLKGLSTGPLDRRNVEVCNIGAAERRSIDGVDRFEEFGKLHA